MRRTPDVLRRAERAPEQSADTASTFAARMRERLVSLKL